MYLKMRILCRIGQHWPSGVPRRREESVAEWCQGAQDRRIQLPTSEEDDGSPEWLRSEAHSNEEPRIGLAVINTRAAREHVFRKMLRILNK